jgi:hypothetical protein
MFTSSKRFQQAIWYGYELETLCQVVDAANTYVVRELNVTGGSVSVNTTSATRRSCNLKMIDPTGELVPHEWDDILQPYAGYYLKLFRGVRYRNDETEMFPLGTFAPFAPKIMDDGEKIEISITGYDRSKIIARNRWTKPYHIYNGTNVGTAIKSALNSRMPGLQYNIQPTTKTVAKTTFGTTADNDPWKDMQNLASSVGMEVFFDARDIVIVRDVPDPDFNSPVHTYDDGNLCTVTEFDQDIDSDKMYTGVIVTSESSAIQPPIRAEVWLDDAAVQIPYFFPTGLVTTYEQAVATGLTILSQVARSEQSVTVHAVPDPRHEDGDIVRVKRLKSKLDSTYLVEGISMPLDESAEMTLTMQDRRLP